jgi:hypothetical protein
MSQNKNQNVGRIFQEFYSICNREKASDCLEAIKKSLTILLVLNYHKRDVKNILLQLAKDVLKEYNEIYSNQKGF